jgi:hypothetical protein
MDDKSPVEGITGLCLGAYWATQYETKLTLHAVGWHPHSGCSSDPDRKSPYFAGESPDFEFLHTCTLGQVLPVLTPFDVSDTFESERVEFVTIVDAQGKHEIPVQQEPVCPCKEEEVTTAAAKADREKD